MCEDSCPRIGETGGPAQATSSERFDNPIQ